MIKICLIIFKPVFNLPSVSAWSCLLLLSISVVSAFAQPLSERGLLNTPEHLEFIHQQVNNNEEPWTSGYKAIKSYLDHEPQPFQHYIDPAAHQGSPGDIMQPILRADSEAAYGSALHWVVTRDEAHAKKAIEILNAWSWKIESIHPWEDGPLSTSYNWPRMMYAADIIRKTYDGWSEEDQEQFARVLRSIVWPGSAGRAIDKDNKNNWRSHAVHNRLTIAVYLEDEEWFSEAIFILKDQIASYCYPSGQSIETVRDMYHSQMGIGAMVTAAEIAWNQGVDVYSYLNNRLLRCVEWHIPHIMGLENADWPDTFDSPFYAPDNQRIDGDYVVKWERRVPVRRGRFDQPRAVGRALHFYEIVHNHYHNRKGLDTPNTEKMLLEKSPAINYDEPPSPQRMIPARPEGSAFIGGWGTLTHTRLDLVE
ncbi:MAG: alginate lyase family protein [Balneolales bacterium]